MHPLLGRAQGVTATVAASPEESHRDKGSGLIGSIHLRIWIWGLFPLSLFLPNAARAQTLALPIRATNALSGAEFVRRIAPLALAEREKELISQFNAGNVPKFLRTLAPVAVTNVVAGKTNTATFYVTPDYLAIGSEEDYFLAPMSPNMAQRIADSLGCSLPTRKMVNDTYAAAAVKLVPAPIPPSPAMTTVAVFSNHNAIVHGQRAEHLGTHPLGALVAGHQKDVVITAKLAAAPGKVAIYGWHQTNGVPIQPLYLGHAAAWVDYSQCIRLVQQQMTVNGEATTVAKVLADPALAGLLSDEGVISNPRYPTNALPELPTKTTSGKPLPALDNQHPTRNTEHATRNTQHESSTTNSAPTSVASLQPSPYLHERIASFTVEPEVKVHVNAPAQEAFSPGKKVLLIFYALPNGNTTDQTIGRILKTGDDWHYDIQHIGAQTRFLRQMVPDRAIVVAYLENDLKSWPAWRKKHGDKLIPEILDKVKKLFAGSEMEIGLSGHSGGGSLIFGYLNALERIPDDVVRIAFLDSNYAYDRALGHKDKLAGWLKAGSRHCLCVLAYNDAVALLDGKSFVSAAGGTWGRSHAMQRDLAEDFKFTSQTNTEFQKFFALDGRLQFLLKENPERKIFHTVQVERNGFIHCLVCGTANEGKGYEYFGERAYRKWIQPE